MGPWEENAREYRVKPSLSPANLPCLPCALRDSSPERTDGLSAFPIPIDHSSKIMASLTLSRKQRISAASCSHTTRISGHKRQTLASQSPESANDEEAGKQDASRAADCDNDGGGEKNNILIFACPYLRRDPVRHKTCLNLKLKRIRDVKQHLQRRHFPPLYYCPTCFMKFPSEIRRDIHVRSRRCEPREAPSEDMVHPRIQALLKQPVSRKCNPEHQWHSIYEILFPRGPVSGKPYLGNVVEESIGMIRQYWMYHGSRLAAEHLTTSKLRHVNNQQLDQIMIRLLDDVSGQLNQAVLESDDAQVPGTASAVSPEWELEGSDAGTHSDPSLSVENIGPLIPACSSSFLAYSPQSSMSNGAGGPQVAVPETTNLHEEHSTLPMCWDNGSDFFTGFHGTNELMGMDDFSPDGDEKGMWDHLNLANQHDSLTHTN